MTEQQEIKSTLEDYAKAYCAKDINALMHVFEDSNDISVIGTGADELCVGRHSVKELFLRNFAEATASEFEWQWSKITILNDYAVVAISLAIHLDSPSSKLKIPIRWSVALRKTDRWVWLHRHASSPASNQDKGQAYPQEA
ncbi:nuclear transport factor 2 family protein [Shewanella sp. KX20019]|uniref:nuclear transport factor 2 family protein n=1 Tax=Shewanella sp. KX20019 TaxID=2803864 RepID=UPI0019265138|nr:nuclear transport factor 2 family protein [Shewanella sp. KX20019]QQX78648.1 nuclear transport factor 2 family protein [Shewanella sp. KX20019]